MSARGAETEKIIQFRQFRLLLQNVLPSFYKVFFFIGSLNVNSYVHDSRYKLGTDIEVVKIHFIFFLNPKIGSLGEYLPRST